jgi:hypothetical protein
MDITKYFTVPISTIKKKYEVDKNIIKDLEILTTNDADTDNLYSYVFNPSNKFATDIQTLWSDYYTDDTRFLKESQELYKSFKISNTKDSDYLNKIYLDYILYKTDTGFKEKYGFIDWTHIEFLNHSEYFLLILSLAQILSPIFSLVLPILFLLMPYFILKIQGVPVTISVYADILTRLFRGHVITKILNGDLFSGDIKTTVYLIGTLLIYAFQIYNNIMSCIRFHHYMTNLHSFFTDINNYLSYSIKNMELYLNYINEMTTYSNYKVIVQSHIDTLNNYSNKIKKINSYSWSINQLLSLGYIQRNFYSIYNDDELHKSIMFSFGFHGYIDNILGIQQNITNKNMGYCNYSKKKNTKITKGYFCNNDNPVKNTYQLNKKFIITGPNASGKTTLLKSTLFNIILSQQLGCGYYSKATINPYRHIHCYLNIPDTSGRDSLFQAEARRCKEIMESTKNNKDKHFCIFDELYSGTNPYEAEASSYSFIKYLSEFKNVDFMMTTHLINLCENINKNKKIMNYNMKTENVGDCDFKYKYKIEKGISQIKGAVKVLKELEYPEDIIKTTLKYLKDN